MAGYARKTKEQYRQAAKSIAAGETIKSSLLNAGFALSTANLGRTAIEQSPLLQKALREELKGQFKAFMDLGASVSAKEQEDIARGRLLQNIMDGSDAGVQSAKLLWQDKRVNQLVAENQLGVIVVNGAASLPTIEAEEVTPGLLTDGSEPAS